MNIRSIIQTACYWLAGGSPAQSSRIAVRGALGWLCTAQDAADRGGIPRAYSLRFGWQLPYPETTGYIIPTLLEHAAAHTDLGLEERAWMAGYWLTDVQFESGAICSKQHRPGNTTPSVFNTGQVLHGWVSLLEQRQDQKIYVAASKAVNWLINEQEADGSWVHSAFLGRAHAYYTMVDWALVRYANLMGDERARAAAVRNLNWTLRNQRENGWYDHCDFGVGDAVLTHTISYTTQGLVESGRLLGDQRYIESAVRGTDKLRECFEERGILPGTFDENWQATSKWECCTGSAQTSLVWQVLGEATDDRIWHDSARKLNRHLLGCQKVGCRKPEIAGAIPGSWPISGGYDPYNFPNHAAKFFIDALTGPAEANEFK